MTTEQEVVRIQVSCECPHGSEVHIEEVPLSDWEALSDGDRDELVDSIGAVVMGNFASYGVSVLGDDTEEQQP